MPKTICGHCGSTCHWRWEEAFDKFGFGDGGGLTMTETVATTLRTAGYTVTVEPWGNHNVVISDIQLAAATLIPATARRGYDNPRSYLPAVVTQLLDRELPQSREVQP